MHRIEGQQIHYSYQSIQNQGLQQKNNIKEQFALFIQNFQQKNDRLYHNQLLSKLNSPQRTILISLGDLKSSSQELYKKLLLNPIQTVKLFEKTCEDIAQKYKKDIGEWQVQIWSDQNPIKIRDLLSSKVNRLVTISGLIISATKPFSRGSKLELACSNCGQSFYIQTPIGQSPSIPMICIAGKRNAQGIAMEQCPKNTLKVCPAKKFVQDYQWIKIEQNPEEIPIGQIPRTYSMLLGRNMVGRLSPGERITVTGTLMILSKQSNLKQGYVYILGFTKLNQKADLAFSPHQQQQFKVFSKDPNIHKKITNSIAPKIYGHNQIKKAIACQLFGGSRKQLPDKTLLRGDLNILLVGDPSTAKSQFLLFAQKLSYISVYTSGKASSAAGLTASINRDSASGQFQIEAGALVRADGGLVCIDEFDKMKSNDRVAIHQAMEQQTISISKAGLNSRLNSRTSVLAAANPIFGRYDDMKQISDQIEMQTTIMSRFDCIFIVKDIRDENKDSQMVKHILNLHALTPHVQKQGQVPMEFLKKYIGKYFQQAYAKAKINPRITVQASEKLKNLYIEDRKLSKEDRKTTRHAIPITVRQLQAIIRLSQVIKHNQSLAKMQLKAQVRQQHVNQAHRIFKSSTLSSLKNRKEIGNLPGMSDQILKIEQAIKRKIYVGLKTSVKNLVNEIGQRFQISLVNIAIKNMINNGEFQELNKGNYVVRKM